MERMTDDDGNGYKPCCVRVCARVCVCVPMHVGSSVCSPCVFFFFLVYMCTNMPQKTQTQRWTDY